MSEVECGLACLAMVLGYFRCGVSLSELRTRSGVGRDGLSALEIVTLARGYGLRVRALSIQPRDFRVIQLPVIVHWEFNHFLIVEGWSRRHVSVVDPAKGRYRMRHGEFDLGFSGVVVLAQPGVAFQRRAGPSRPVLRSYIAQYLSRTPGALLQILAVSLLLLALGLALPLLTKVVVDRVLPYQMTDVMPVLGIGILALFLATTVGTLLREWLLVYLRARIDIDLMLGFVEHLLALPYTYFQQRSSGDLLARVSSNAALREILSNQLLSAVIDSVLVSLYLTILIAQSPFFGLITLLFGIVQVALLLLTSRRIGRLAHRELSAFGKAQGYLAEVFQGIATVKAAGAEPRAFERWSNVFFDHLNIALRYNYASASLTAVLTAFRSLGQLALLWVGANQVLQGSITLGTMVALLALATAFFAPLGSLVSSGQQFQLVGANLERISDVTQAEPEQSPTAVEHVPGLSGRIELKDVHFRYEKSGPEVLRRLNLSVAPGQAVAIVGVSGSGKSTLGKLLLALYEPTSGEIVYDGRPLQGLNWQQVRRQFGVVLQESVVFSGSILSNITFNNPGLDRHQAAEAGRTAGIHDDILAMPMGYDTFVSESGSGLSGGQRQRLCIARAVADKPPILLLDEATSHLDVETEQRVAKNLQALACTQIVIAHRLSTVRKADTILVLDSGVIVEQGAHDELIRRGGPYARLVLQQIEPASDRASPGTIPRRPRGGSDSFSQFVADVVRTAQASDVPIQEAVGAAFGVTAQPTAERYIREARQRGLLPESERSAPT